MMKHIQLSQGKIALVDDGDYDFLSQWRWYAHKERSGYYAVRKSARCNGKQKMIYMHTVLLGTPAGKKGDHADRNTLNNQRENLRIATNSQNGINRKGNTKNKYGGLKGVSRSKSKYRAVIKKEGKSFSLGSFHSAVEAAKAYDEKAKELFGDFACLNFPDL